MTINKRWLRLVALLGALALVAAACGGDDSGEATTTTADPGGGATTTTVAATTTTVEPMTGGEISFYISEPPFIDPSLVQDNQGFEVVRLLFDGLTLYSPEGGAVVPGVAESWEANDDLTVWTFNLRDSQWPDGSPVTAQDFIYGWGRAADPDSASRVAYHGSIAGIVGWDEVNGGDADGTVGNVEIPGLRAVDDSTLEITLNQTNSLLPKILAHPVFSPAQQSVVEADPEAFAEMPVGNGPYKMSEPWQHDVAINVERSDTYYGTPGLPDSIEFRVYSTQDAAWLDFQAGNVDVVRGVPDEALEQARVDLGDRLIEQPTGSFTYLGLPWSFEPFQNADLRRALLMAIDTEAINERIFIGRDTPRGFVPGVANGAIEDGCPWCRFDPTEAKALYDSVGGVPNDELNIVFNSGAGHEQWVEAVANDWGTNLGITANFQGFEWAAYLDYLFGETPNTDPFRLGWGWDYPSGYNFLAPLYGCESADNLTGFCSPELDVELNKVITSLKEEDGIPALQEAQRIVGDLIPVIPITYGRSAVAYSEDLSNVRYTDFGFFIFEDVVVDRG